MPGLWKGSLLASAEGNRVSVAWFAGLVLALCLFPGCSSRRSATDLYRDALSLREAGKDRSAANTLNKAIKADPALAAAYAELGKIYEELGESDKALASFRQAARLEPSSFENQMNLAKAYEKSDKPLQAAIAYGRAVALDPNDFDALTGAAACCVQAGQYARAQAYCEQAPPDRQELLPLLARAYEGQQDYARAMEVYERLSATGSPDPNVLLSLGVACVKAGRYDRAQEVLVSVSQMRPQDGAALRHLGYCFIKRGDLEQAIQTYLQAIRLDDNDWEAYRNLGVACMLKARQSEGGRWEEQALRHWRRSLLIKPDQPKHEVLEKLIRESSKRQNPMQGLND